jgi:hypothetical protein
MPDPPGTKWFQEERTRQQTLQRNMPYVNRANIRPWNTTLPPAEEQLFRSWLQQNNVPFDPDVPVSDYDMRGFWQSLMQGDERAKSGVDPNDKRLHYPDYWKTPYHESFSGESQWALPMAPRWNEQDQLIAPSGRIIFDDKKR